MSYCTKCGNELPADAKVCPRCGAPVEPAQATTAPQAPPTGYASTLTLAFWGERFVAWLIDAIILSVILGFLGLFSWFAVGTFTWLPGWPNWIPFFNVGSLVYFFYWLVMDGMYGQSRGKMVMCLKVVRLDGNKIDMGQAAVESVGKAFILPIDLIVGWIMYPRSRQRLFNRLSGTVVVRQRSS